MLELLLLIVLVAYRALCLIRKKDAPPLPPGPPAEPLLGHYRIVPQDAAFKQYAQWAKEYSMSPTMLECSITGKQG